MCPRAHIPWMTYISPWISQLRRVRPALVLEGDTRAGVTIVGGGIAGMATAYFALSRTDREVLMVEAGKIGHGASGHNAGQAVSYFERPFQDIAAEFGLPLAAAAQREIIGAWDLLEGIFREAVLRTPLMQFTGYAGFTTPGQVISRLESMALFREGGLEPEATLLSRESGLLRHIPAPLRPFCSLRPGREILDLLETSDSRYIACAVSRKGCMNSALFSEELAGFLLARYPDRFRIAEHTPVREVVLSHEGATLTTEYGRITSDRVVLCTNGFTGLRFSDPAGQPLTVTGQRVRGTVGYMTGYMDPIDRDPTAIRYYSASTSDHTVPYYYLTRRHYEPGKGGDVLLCAGGPETDLPAGVGYEPHRIYIPGAHEELQDFLGSTYRPGIGSLHPRFLWHGLMGYTPGGIRLAGPDPRYRALLYNLGCNGVGILPSVAGGLRIARHLAGEELGASIFDPGRHGENRP
jgi:glycine/D-amino acid oxidase-like deaminating enzyme